GFNSLVHSLRALSALRRSGLRTASTTAKPYQGDSSEFYLITGIPTVTAAGQKGCQFTTPCPLFKLIINDSKKTFNTTFTTLMYAFMIQDKPKTLRFFKFGVIRLIASYGVMSSNAFVGTLFKMYMACLTTSAQKFCGMFVAFIIHLVVDMIVLFLLSTTSFCCGVGGEIGPYKSTYTKSKGEVDLAFALLGNGALLCFPIKQTSQICVVSDSSSGVNVVNENTHSSEDVHSKSMREIGEQIGMVWDKDENHSLKDNNSVGGSTNFGFVQSNEIGRSGGLLLVWDSNVSVVGGERFIAAKGNWKGVDGDVMLVNVYGAHVTEKKMALWDRISALINTVATGWCLFGDFNEVREPYDWLNMEFNARDADNFNEFIRLNSLVEIQLGGRKYTRISDDGLKFSNLDRFLVTPEFSAKWDNLSVIALDRKISDHCPILLKDMDLDYGPKPFRVFDLWLEDGEIDVIVKDAWEIPMRGSRPDCRVRDTFKNVKEALKRWSRIKFGGTKQQIEARKEWVDKENEMVSVLQQKARIKWDIKGDENSKFFHAIVKRRYNKNNI
nr:hypothetical protein [Tanacetum cinerariifolium]